MTLPAIERGGISDANTTYTAYAVFASGTRAALGAFDPLSGNPQPPMLPPPGFLQADDRALLEVAAGDANGTRYRAQQRPVSGQSTGSSQLPVYPDLTYDANGVTWTGDRFDPTTLPGWDTNWAPPPTWIGWGLSLSTGDLDGEQVRVQSNGGGPP